MTEYLGQSGPGMCCICIAMCNALRFWGLASPAPDNLEWEIMVEIAGCRHGSAIHEGLVADWLGLVRVPTSLHFLRRGEQLPAMMSFRSPECGLHAALVIDTKEGKRPWAPDLHFANYRGTDEGPVLEWVEWDEVAWHDGNRDQSLGSWLVPRWCSPGEDVRSPGVRAFKKALKAMEARKEQRAKQLEEMEARKK